jgi:hypothetical protein
VWRPPPGGGSTERRTGLRLAAACVAVTLLLAGTGTVSTRDRPPAAHTGAFGEPSCQTCHSDAPDNAGPGALRLVGVPERYRPGGVYDLTLELADPALRAAGYQLTARYEDGAQAGVVAVAAPEAARSAVTVERGVQYAHHIYDGTLPDEDGTARWRLVWHAPDSADAVVFSAAAVAADDDLSPLGDRVYTTTRATAPAPSKAPSRVSVSESPSTTSGKP